MKSKVSRESRILALAGAFLILLGTVALAVMPRAASAAQIYERSLTLEAGTTDGGSMPGGTVKHFFQFKLPAVGDPNVGSIKFLYCTLAAGACVTPDGLDTTSATLDNQTGATGFSIDTDDVNGSPYITRTAASITADTAVSYRLGSVVNPDADDCPANATAPSCTFFVRIFTYASTDTSGSAIDSGVVAASVNEQITLTGTMPESLVFCTGGSVSTTSGVPDCATATSGAVAFNQLFSPTDTATATSQMAASTNAGFGYNIIYAGVTLTSGSNTIVPMSNTQAGAPTAGVRGISQFGLNLKANTTDTSTPAVGTEVAPAANGTNYKGQAVTNYNTIDSFKFFSSNTVADSSNGGAGGTDAQIFTVSYIVNVSGSQPAGTYTTTLTYICTPTF